MKKLETFDLSYFRGKGPFVDTDVTKNYLVFQPRERYFKVVDKIIQTIFHHGNLKDCLMKVLNLLLNLTIVFLHKLIILELMGVV